MSARVRFVLSGIVLVVSIFVANRFGLVALIANGYRILSYVFLAVYVLPVMTYGVWCLVIWYRRRPALPEARVNAVS